MCAKWITWDTIPIWSKQQKALPFLLCCLQILMTLTLEERANMMSKQRRHSQPSVFLFCEAASWMDDAEGRRCSPFPLIPPNRHLHVFVTPPRRRAVCEGASWGRCISVCWTGSLQSGVGMAGLQIADWPLLSVLPLRQGHFSFLKSKSFYKVERCISEWQRKRNSRRQQAGADISWQNFQCSWGGHPGWEFLISRCCCSKWTTRQRGSFFYVVAQQSIKKLTHLFLNHFATIVWNKFM